MSANAGGLCAGRSSSCCRSASLWWLLQGVSEIIKCVAALTTGYVREHAYEKPVQ